MKPIIPPINTPDGKFTEGNGSTIRGTPVTADWLNNMQGAVITNQTEISNVITGAGLTINPADQTQLKQAITRLAPTVKDGTLTQKGIVQLSDAVNSTSTTLASTANATKIAYDKGVEALNSANKKAPISHTHTIDDVTGLRGELDKKLDTATSGIKVTGTTAGSNSGVSVSNTKAKAIAIGRASSVSVDGDIAIGDNARVVGAGGLGGGIVIGADSKAYSSDTEKQSIVIGDGSCTGAIAGYGVTSVGSKALASLTTADRTCAFGAGALKSLKTSNTCNAFGFEALSLATYPANNAFGHRALWQLTTGRDNVGIGEQAGFNLKTASYNVTIGTGATAKSDGTYSVAVGSHAGYAEGSFNTCVGALAGKYTVGDPTGIENSVALGYNSSLTRSKEVSVGNQKTDGVGTRFIANVTDGVLPKDAVNKSQLDSMTVFNSTYMPFGKLTLNLLGGHEVNTIVSGNTIDESLTGSWRCISKSSLTISLVPLYFYLYIKLPV